MERDRIPAIVREDPEGRTARISRNEGGPIGAAMFFTPEELLSVGVDPTTAEAVELRIVDGDIELIPIVQKSP
jgi:hypothetical protein